MSQHSALYRRNTSHLAQIGLSFAFIGLGSLIYFHNLYFDEEEEVQDLGKPIWMENGALNI
jgi:hypothetical protein